MPTVDHVELRRDADTIFYRYRGKCFIAANVFFPRRTNIQQHEVEQEMYWIRITMLRDNPYFA